MTASVASAPLIGGRLCLDFANADLTGSYQDLVEWARRAGALDAAEADFVLERLGAGPEAESALETARVLQRRIRDFAEPLAAGSRRLVPEAIDAINQALRSRPGYLQLEPDGSEWAARWKVPLRRPDDVLWRIARSAASLLADDDLSLVRRCERSSCRLFFFDTTKNHRKRYCRMEVCGVAERAAAYYRRKKS